MAPLQRQLSVVINIVLLIAITALGGYAVHVINRDSIPISTSLAAISIVLPSLAGVVTETVRATHKLRETRLGKQHAYLSTYMPIIVLTILETVLVTLAGTHIAPAGDLGCGLENKWQRLFMDKNEDRIRRIQDQFQCCGLRSIKDKAWPFPDKQHNALTCSKTYGRTKSCFGDWRQSEQHAAGILLAIPILVFAWQIFTITAPSNRNSWIDQLLRRQTSGSSGERERMLITDGGNQRAIGYRDNEEPIINQAIEDDDDDEYPQETRDAASSLRRTATNDAREVIKQKKHQRKKSAVQSHPQPAIDSGLEHNAWTAEA